MGRCDHTIICGFTARKAHSNYHTPFEHAFLFEAFALPAIMVGFQGTWCGVLLQSSFSSPLAALLSLSQSYLSLGSFPKARCPVLVVSSILL